MYTGRDKLFACKNQTFDDGRWCIHVHDMHNNHCHHTERHAGSDRESLDMVIFFFDIISFRELAG